MNADADECKSHRSGAIAKSMSEPSKVSDRLTEKQREVIELLLEHMTSKEIAAQLDVSHHTVDQRIGIAKKKFDVNTRSELVSAYKREMVSNQTDNGKPVYEESYIPTFAIPLSKDLTSDAESDLVLVDRKPREYSVSEAKPVSRRVVPEVFDGRLGSFWRIGAIAGLAAIMLLVGLAGLSMFGQLSELFGG